MLKMTGLILRKWRKQAVFQNWHASCNSLGMGRRTGRRADEFEISGEDIMTSHSIFASSTLTNLTAGFLAVAATFATVSTVRAETGTADFRTQVEHSIDQTLRLPQGKDDFRKGIATVAVTVGADGKVVAADLVRSSGISIFDREALRTAHVASYPATGKTRTIAMVLGFNRTVTPEMQGEAGRAVLAWRDENRVMLANRIAAQQPDI